MVNKPWLFIITIFNSIIYRIDKQSDLLFEYFLNALSAWFGYLASYLLETIFQGQKVDRLTSLCISVF